MHVLTAPLGSLSLLAIIHTFYILANLSRRYGEVIRLPRYYRGLYFAIGLICLAFISHLIQDSVIIAPEKAPALFNSDWFYVLTYFMPMGLAVTLALGIAWRYWSWLLKEQKE